MDFKRKRRTRLLTKLAYFTYKIRDPYNKEFYTTLEAFVPKPDAQYPLPCILVSIRNGHQRLFFRVSSVKELLLSFKVPKSARERLSNALMTANHEADRIEQDYKLLFAKRQLAPGGSIVRTDTGEIIAEAERILKKGR